MRVRLPNDEIAHIRADTDWDTTNWLEENFHPGTDKSYKELGYFFSKNTSHPNAHALPILNFYKRIFGYRNLGELHRVHQQHAYSLKKADVLKDLPPKTYQIRRLEMPKEQRDAYITIRSKYKLELDGTIFTFSDRTSPYAKLHTISNGFIYDENHKPVWLKSQPKLEELAHILDELNDEKVVIWCAYPAQILQVQEFLKKELDISSETLHGITPAAKRPDIIHAFEKDINYLIANPEVAGLGLNLTFSHIQIFMSTWCKSDTRSQAEDRQHRQGQFNPVSIIDLIMKGTIESAILRNSKNEINLENKVIRMSDLADTWEN